MNKKSDNTVAEPVEMNWAPATLSSMADDLDDKLLFIRPISREERDGDFGRQRVTISEVWIVQNSGKETEVSLYGEEVPIRWQVVQRQLDGASQDAPWIAGTLEKKGRAYILTPPGAREIETLSVALPMVQMLREAGTATPTYVPDDSF